MGSLKGVKIGHSRDGSPNSSDFGREKNGRIELLGLVKIQVDNISARFGLDHHEMGE